MSLNIHGLHGADVTRTGSYNAVGSIIYYHIALRDPAINEVMAEIGIQSTKSKTPLMTETIIRHISKIKRIFFGVCHNIVK